MSKRPNLGKSPAKTSKRPKVAAAARAKVQPRDAGKQKVPKTKSPSHSKSKSHTNPAPPLLQVQGSSDDSDRFLTPDHDFE